MPDGSLTARSDQTSLAAQGNFGPYGEDREADAIDWSGEGQSRSYLVRLGMGEIRIDVENDHLPSWLVSILERLSRIASLPAGWDSYGASPIKQSTLEYALSVIIKLMESGMPLPQVSAMVSGGVEYEWHIGAKSLEMQVTAPFRVHAYFYDEDNPEEEWEDDVDLDLDPVKLRLRELTR